MNLEHPNFGLTYRLSGLAIRLRRFTVSELNHITGIKEDTIYGFVAKLSQQGYVEAVGLARTTRGRPINRYSLTEAGLDYLLQKNARIAAILSDNSVEDNRSEETISGRSNGNGAERAAKPGAEIRPAVEEIEAPRYAADASSVKSNYRTMS
jgi:DNA-binding PadR family transcriptional regulator